jgi:hypothetical protein
MCYSNNIKLFTWVIIMGAIDDAKYPHAISLGPSAVKGTVQALE